MRSSPGFDSWASAWASLKENLSDLALPAAVLLLVAALACYFIIRLRHRRRHGHHHHGHRPRSGPPADAKTDRAEFSSRSGRRRRRHHRPRNPTLAETGGLPPVRTDPPSTG